MNLKNQPPIFVPEQYRAEIEKLSKAALMDIAWDYAMMVACGDDDDAMKEFRRERDIILQHRAQDRDANGNWRDRLYRPENV